MLPLSAVLFRVKYMKLTKLVEQRQFGGDSFEKFPPSVADVHKNILGKP